MPVRFPEIGFYTLPGRVANPQPMLQEVRDAEALGLGSVWISERHDVKESAVLSGAAAAATSDLAGAAGVILHASAPREMQSLLQAYATERPAQRFTGRSPVPGRS